MTLISNGPQAPNVTRKDLISKKEDVQINALRYMLYDSFLVIKSCLQELVQRLRRQYGG